MTGKRITHLITTIERGGAENQLLILCQEQIKDGWQVDVKYLKGRAELASEFLVCGVEVRKLGGGAFLSQLLEFRKLMRHSDVSLVHAHLPRCELMAILSKIAKPIIVSRHNSEKFFPKAPDFISRILSRMVLHRADGRIAISRGVLDFLYRSGEASRKTPFCVIHYGFQFPREALSAKFFDPQRPRFLSIGRLVQQKDYPTILLALAKLKSIDLSFEASFVGEGSLEKKLKLQSQELGLTNNVRWLGKIMHPEHLFANSDFLILASVYEGFGMVLLESLATELPIICSRIPTSIEILGDDYEGFFAPGDPESLYQTICFALENRAILIEKMRSRRRLFYASDMAKKVSSIYLSVS